MKRIQQYLLGALLLLSCAGTAYAEKTTTPEALTPSMVQGDEPSNRQLTQLGLSGAELQQVHTGIWKASKGKKHIGYVVASKAYAPHVKGFRGATPVLIYIDKSKTIKCFYALPNNETGNYMSRAMEVLGKWKGKKTKSVAHMTPDAISGATYSSNSLTQNVKAAIAAFNKYVK